MIHKKLNIAIFSPNQNKYSESFILAHKLYLEGSIFYYHGRESNITLNNQPNLLSSLAYLSLKLQTKILNKPTNYIWKQGVSKSLKNNKIDVALIEYGNHAHALKDVFYKFNIPIVVHFHGYDASRQSVIKDCNNYKALFSIAHKIIAVSKVMEQKLLDLGCPREKLVYNVYGPQPEFHEVNATLQKKQFIGIGRFTDKKAPYYTILAFKAILEKHPDAKLLLAGQGTLLNACKNLVKAYGIEKNVEFLGVITPDEYREYLSESLAFVQHSITAHDGDMEGTPLAVLEASAAGLPVIATKHAGIPDVIVDNKTGLLCDEHDIIQMSKNMLSILDDVKFAMQLGKAGKQHILKYYSLERHIDDLNAILSNA